MIAGGCTGDSAIRSTRGNRVNTRSGQSLPTVQLIAKLRTKESDLAASNSVTCLETERSVRCFLFLGHTKASRVSAWPNGFSLPLPPIYIRCSQMNGRE